MVATGRSIEFNFKVLRASAGNREVCEAACASKLILKNRKPWRDSICYISLCKEHTVQ